VIGVSDRYADLSYADAFTPGSTASLATAKA